MNKVFAILFAAAACLTANPQSVPQLINYQGRLADANGAPVADGAKLIAVTVYDKPGSDGTPLWGPTEYPDTPIVGGQFNVILGSDGNGDPITDALAGTGAYLQLSVNGADIVPRQQLLSAPYALVAEYANNVPVGSVQSYFGLGDPKGWLACDGRVIDQSENPEYAGLVQHLRGLLGNGGADYRDPSAPEDENRAVLPDLRGQFLRGLNSFGTASGEVSDPEVMDPNGEGRTLGSKQQDAFKSHKHMLELPRIWGDQTYPGYTGYSTDNLLNGSSSKETTNTGHPDETRPRNTAISFIVKY